MTDEGPVMLTPRQVQRMLQLSPSTVYRMLNSGLIPSVRIGRSRRVPADAIPRLVRSDID
jgi:excisionase family DNA binding protein